MSKFIVKINDTTELPLVDWDGISFVSNPRLRIASSNLVAVKEAFADIEKIQVFQNEILVGETTEYDTYHSIQYLGNVFSVPDNMFTECLQVDLLKTSLAEQVDRITNELFPTIDFDSMTVEEYRTWLLADIARQCQEDIYQGSFVQISTGTKHFRYTMEDQQNIQSAVAILMSVPELPAMPYHADGEGCYLMSKADLMTVYMTLHMRLLALTTRCNYLNVWIRGMETKEEMMEVDYTTELPLEYQNQVDAIMASAIEMMETLREKYIDGLLQNGDPELEDTDEETDDDTE